MIINITYKGYNEIVDNEILKALSSIGATCIGQGYNTNKNIRDICLELSKPSPGAD